MKKIALLFILLYPSLIWGQKDDLIKFLDAHKTLEFEESKEVIAEHSFDLGNLYDIMSYSEPTGIFFETDTLSIKGYKAIINCKIKNKAEQYIDKKMIAVMYLNKQKNIWCVGMFREAIDPKQEYNTAKSDVDAGQFYTQKQYVYRNLSYWSIYAGKLNEAIKWIKTAEQEANKANDSKFNIESHKNILNKIL